MNTMTKQHPFLEKYFGNKSFEQLLSDVQSNKPENIKAMIGSIEKMMKTYATKITYSQIRNIFQLVKNEEKYTGENGLGEFYKTLPKLAYTEARLKEKDEGRKVVSFIRELAGAVTQKEQYPAFVDIMDAIVAYHKLHGKN